MDSQRFLERKADFLKAVDRLEEACRQPKDAFLRDSVIQRFEFCWELAWKTLRMWLEHLGIEAGNPRDTWQEALKAGLIEDGNAWSALQKMRNLTSRTYDESLAEQVYAYIVADGQRLFRQLAGRAETWHVSQ